MSAFYYRELPALGLVRGFVAYVDEKPAGFIAATHDASGFMRDALKKRLPQLIGTLVRSVARHPARMASMLEGVRIMWSLPATAREERCGEILSFGVLRGYRDRRFVAHTGLRISQDLLDGALHLLHEEGTRRVRVVVDADNLEARLFYLGSGWRPGADRVQGWSRTTVEFLRHAPLRSAPHPTPGPRA